MSSNKINPRFIRANNRIRANEVRLINGAGEQVGIVAIKDALNMAQEEGLDLVEVAAEARPPVCRIMDLGKYLYNIGKKEKESRKKQKVTTVKEVKLSSKIQEHDFQTKLRNARRFIERGDKVKLTMFFRGREITHTDLGIRVIDRFIEEIADMAQVERNEGLAGRSIQVYLQPAVGTKKQTTKKKESGSSEPNQKEAENAQS